MANQNKKITDLPLLTGFSQAIDDYRFEVADLTESLIANQSKQVRLGTFLNRVSAGLTLRFDQITGDAMTNPSLATYLANLAQNTGSGGGGTAYNFDANFFTKNNNTWTLNDLPQSKIIGLQESFNNKVDKITGKGLSTFDFDATYKAKVDLLQTSGTGDTFLSSDGTYKTVSGGGGGTTLTDGTSAAQALMWDVATSTWKPKIPSYLQLADLPPIVTLTGVIGFTAAGVTYFTDEAVNTLALANGSVTAPKLSITGTPDASKVIGYTNGSLAWVTAPTGTGGGYAAGTNTNQVLKWNGTTYTAVQLQYSELGGLPPVAELTGDVRFFSDGSTLIQPLKVTTEKIADGAVTVPKINAGGTPSNTTFLRGDGMWATPPAGAGGSATSLDGLTDVSVPTATESNFLQYRSSAQWTAAPYFDVKAILKPASPNNETLRFYSFTLGFLTEMRYVSASGYESSINDTVIHCTNTTANTIAKGQAVYVSGGTANTEGLPTIAPARANAAATAEMVLMAMQDIAAGATGRCALHGKVYNVNTSAFTLGADLYVSPDVAGSLTATRPTGTNVIVFVGKVTHVHATQGIIAFNIGPRQSQPGTSTGGSTYTDAQALSAVGAKLTNTQVVNLTYNTSNSQITGTLNYSGNADGTISFQQDAGGLYAHLKTAERNSLLSRSNHTGTQEINTVNGLQAALNGKISAIAQASDYDNTTPATAGQVIAWNAATGKFAPATQSAGTSIPSGTSAHQTARWTGSALQWVSNMTNNGSTVGMNRNLDTPLDDKWWELGYGKTQLDIYNDRFDTRSIRVFTKLNDSSANFREFNSLQTVYSYVEMDLTNAVMKRADNSIIRGDNVQHVGIMSYVRYGTNNPASKGTTHNFSAITEVHNSPDIFSEHNFSFASLVYGDNATGRCWFTDWTVVGPKIQPGLLNGVTLNIQNRYNGDPAHGTAGGIWVTTSPGTGGNAHWVDASQTYPMQYGIGVTGHAGKNINGQRTNGFKVAFKAGGIGSAWSNGHSRIGIGLQLDDITEKGIHFMNPQGVGLASGVDFDIQAAGRQWNILLNMNNHAPGYRAVIMPANVGVTSGICWAPTTASRAVNVYRSADAELSIQLADSVAYIFSKDGIGINTPVSTTTFWNLKKTYNLVSPTGLIIGSDEQITFGLTGSNTAAFLFGGITSAVVSGTGTGGALPTVRGVVGHQSSAENSVSGTAQRIVGQLAEVKAGSNLTTWAVSMLARGFSFATTAQGNGVMTNYAGLRVSPARKLETTTPLTGTNAYGVYIENMTATSGFDLINQATYQNGVFVNQFALYSEGGRVVLSGLPTYENESAAAGAGLVSGELYRTSIGQLMIKL